MDQYFFKVHTRKPKKGRLDQLNLQQLQIDNIISIVHEYTHYLHEVSTHIGTLGLGYAVAFRVILSKYVSKDLSSSDFDLEISTEDANYIGGIDDTLNCLIGDMAPGFPVKNIISYQLSIVSIKVPDELEMVNMEIEIPELLVCSGTCSETLQFNKFYIYEGIAYELERVFAQNIKRPHNDEEDGSEYTILRYFSRHIVPGITIRTLLTLASCSLAYVNCGAMYVSMLERLSIEIRNGKTETDVIKMIKGNVAAEYRDRFDILGEVLHEIALTYSQRSSLKIAFTALEERYLEAGYQRTINPAFEVDMIFDKPFEALLDLVPPCDFMYVFTNRNTFLRDFYGTTKFRQVDGTDLAVHHNIFIAHNHYANVLFYTLIDDIDQFSPEEEEICCPFYTSCDLTIRKENPELCNSTPWKSYDISFNTDKLYCWYGKGVSFLKGIDIENDLEPLDTQIIV